MKKSLSKILARMAKDGDIETVAEIIEEMLEPEIGAEEPTEVVVVETEEGEEPATAGGGNLAGSEVIRNEQAPQCGAATIENAETTVVVDEASLAEVLSRLDQIISLLSPAPAASDDDPVEEIAEAVEEALEAVAEEPAAEILPEAEGTTLEEIAEVVEEVLDPLVPVEGEAAEADCDDPEGEVLSTGDALRTALRAFTPALAKLPKKQRLQVCADISARLYGRGRKGADAGVYAAMSRVKRKTPPDPRDLGKRIMAKRSANRTRRV